jgi:hypothetical protein
MLLFRSFRLRSLLNRYALRHWFQAPPFKFYVILVGIVSAYLVLVEIIKK